jgi:alkaline phosphatase isozyme conversion protein
MPQQKILKLLTIPRNVVIFCLLLLTACSQPQASNLPTMGRPTPTQVMAATIPTQPTLAPTTTATQPSTPTVFPTSTIVLPTPTAPNSDYGAMARKYLVDLLAQTGPRLSGSAAEAAVFVQSAFEGMGYTVQRQAFSFISEEGQSLRSANVMAVKHGESPLEIVVGAHYDSVDNGDGADDNASGLAVLLEAAGRIKKIETPYTIRFMAFGAEENDLNGSKFYVNGLTDAGIRNIIYYINLDSLIAGDLNYVYGDAESPINLRDWMVADADKNGFALEAKSAQEMDNADGSSCDCADYVPFHEAGIRFAYFEATNWNLGDQDGMTQVDLRLGRKGQIRHTKFDTIQYIDEKFPGRIDQHLKMYVIELVNSLTTFKLAD